MKDKIYNILYNKIIQWQNIILFIRKTLREYFEVNSSRNSKIIFKSTLKA